MPVSPAQHAAHTSGIAKLRSSFKLPAIRTIATGVENAVSNGVANAKQNIGAMRQSIAKNGGISPFGLKDIARGNVKP